jgi:uncharacterized membrane protein
MSFLRRLRGYFFAGLVVTAPIGITIWLAWWFVALIDGWVKPVLPAIFDPGNYLPFPVPGVGLLAAFIAITLIGALAANLVGRTLLRYWETLLGRMPVIRSVYKATKQIFQTALSQSGTNFRQVGLVEYPRRGTYVVVFVARELDSSEIGLPAGETYISAFMPTTPNPTSGFLFFLHKNEVRILDLSVEDGAKLVISAGLVTPATIKKHLPGVPAIEKDVIDVLLHRPTKTKAGNGNGSKARGGTAKKPASAKTTRPPKA